MNGSTNGTHTHSISREGRAKLIEYAERRVPVAVHFNRRLPETGALTAGISTGVICTVDGSVLRIAHGSAGAEVHTIPLALVVKVEPLSRLRTTTADGGTIADVEAAEPHP